MKQNQNFQSVNAQTLNEATVAVVEKPNVGTAKVINIITVTERKRKPRQRKSFDQIVERARNLFRKQIQKNTETKRECVLSSITPDLYSDAPRFWEEYRLEVENILDSQRFVKRCEEAELIARNVAEHLVLETKAIRKKVMTEGFAPLQGRERFFTAPIIQDKFYASDVISTDAEKHSNQDSTKEVA